MRSRGTANIPNGYVSRRSSFDVNGKRPRSSSVLQSSGWTPAASNFARLCGTLYASFSDVRSRSSCNAASSSRDARSIGSRLAGSSAGSAISFGRPHWCSLSCGPCDHAVPGAAAAVCHRRRDRQLASPTDAHPGHAGVPARDHLALAELEPERLAAVPRGVELLARAERDTDVVHGHLLACRRLVAVADDQVVDPELEGNVAFGLVEDRTLRGHRQTVTLLAWS